MKKMITITTCIVASLSTSAWAVKDITTRTNPDASLNVEARYCVHVGWTAYNAGLTASTVGTESATDIAANPNTGPTGMVEYASCGGLNGAGNWGRINNGITDYALDANFAPSTSGGTAPDYLGYLFTTPTKNLTEVRWWNTVFATGMPYVALGVSGYQGGAGGGMFGATPELQYLDAPAPHGTWHTITGVTWNPPYDTSLPATDATVRPYVITINVPLSNVWGLRLYGNAKATGNTIDPDGWVASQELAVVGDLDIGDIDLSKNRAAAVNGGTGIISVEHAGTAANLVDGDFTTRVDTYNFYALPGGEVDWIGVQWAAPRYRLGAVGISLVTFGDGGWFDDCAVPVDVQYTTDTVNWQSVPNLDKGRYPDLWQRFWWDAAQVSFLFRFDEINDVLAIRVIGHGNGQGDGDGFLGAYELEVFGAPVIAEICNYDNSPDGSVDAADELLFLNCFSGPTVPYATGCVDRDLDKDGDVDQDDFGVFQRCFSGTGVAADPFCG